MLHPFGPNTKMRISVLLEGKWSGSQP